MFKSPVDAETLIRYLTTSLTGFPYWRGTDPSLRAELQG